MFKLQTVTGLYNSAGFASILYNLHVRYLLHVCVHLSSAVVLDPHLSALLWMAVLATLAIVIIMPQPLGIRALVIITILRLIFSVGLEPTLFLLGAFNVSILHI